LRSQKELKELNKNSHLQKRPCPDTPKMGYLRNHLSQPLEILAGYFVANPDEIAKGTKRIEEKLAPAEKSKSANQ
jgi:hypothetical protein